ncbi:unnamed protein product, partial [Closterium sp. NIES-53]
YDVASLLAHRKTESGEEQVLVRFFGFADEEDEWVSARLSVRPRSLPCEGSECVAVLPGDVVLCFQEASDQALYFDADVRDVQRRRHDVRGCRCRFWVRYRHDNTEVRRIWHGTSGSDQALYFDADVRDVQRRLHDVRGCRCRFWVRYRHDDTECVRDVQRRRHDVRGCWCRFWVRYRHGITEVRWVCTNRGHTATHVSADVRDVQRRRHDVRGYRCPFWVRYRHDNTEGCAEEARCEGVLVPVLGAVSAQQQMPVVGADAGWGCRCRLWVQMPVGGADAGCGCRCRLGVQMPVVGADAGWGCRCRLWVLVSVVGALPAFETSQKSLPARQHREEEAWREEAEYQVERIHLPLLLTNPLPSFPPLPSFTLFPRSGGGASAQDLPKARDRV